jgi:hypothetical protein
MVVEAQIRQGCRYVSPAVYGRMPGAMPMTSAPVGRAWPGPLSSLVWGGGRGSAILWCWPPAAGVTLYPRAVLALSNGLSLGGYLH